MRNEKFLGFFEAEKVMNGECSPDDIYINIDDEDE